MKYLVIILFTLAALSCRQNSPQQPQPSAPPSKIIAYVHWQDQAVAGIQVVLLQTGDTLRTDSNGIVTFSVSPGHYVVRALGITGPGPSLRYLDFQVETQPGTATKVDIVDCLPCV